MIQKTNDMSWFLSEQILEGMTMQYYELTKSQAVLALLIELNRNPYRTPLEMMKVLDVDKNKYYRYLKELNHFFNFNFGRDIKFNKSRKCYEFNSLTGAGGLFFNSREFYTILLTLQVLSQSHFGRESTIFNQLKKLPAVKDDLELISTACIYRDAEIFCGELPENLYHINVGIMSGRKICFTYKLDDRLQKIICSPYRIVFDQGWYLYGYSDYSGDNRTYKILRMKNIEVMNETFRMPPVEKIRVKTTSVPWDFSDNEPVRVELEISGVMVRHVSERLFHPTQKVDCLPGGRLRYSVEVSAPLQMVGWILSFGKDCRVLAPDFLRTAVLESAEEILENCRIPVQG